MKNQKKIKMGKGRLCAISGLTLTAVAAFAIGCSSAVKPEELTVEAGTEFDLYSLLNDGEAKSYRDFSISYGDEKIAIDSNTVVFSKLGEYTVNYSDRVWKIKTQDTTAPVVHITGSYLNLWSSDEVYLPAIVVNDNCDGNIQTYSVEVTSGGKTIPLTENNSFIATNAGPYTVKASAKDSSGNVGTASKEFTVLRKAEIIVKSGATVAVSDEEYAAVLEAGKEYTFAYSVRVNGEDAPDVSATDGFTVADNSYYEVIATATNNADPDDVVEFYTLFREEHVKMLSFTGWNSADVTGTYNLICNPYPAAERTVEQSGGGYAMKAEIKDVHKPDQTLEAQENGWDSIFCAWTLRAWDGLAYSDYKMSFDVTVGGKIKTDSPDDCINVKIGGFENENKEFVVNGRKGEYAEATFHYSSDTTSIYDLWATKDSVFFRLYFFRGQVESISYTIDNVRLTPKTAPTLTVEKDMLNVAEGENIPLSAGELGITATDFFGADVKEIKCTQILFGTTDKTTDWADGESIVSPQEGVYLLTFTATDYYGNTATKQIKVTVGNKDYYAPSFEEYELLNPVEKNTEITLGEDGIADYVTVTDEAGFDLSYRVVKYGAQGAEELSNVTKFTVEGGEYYEVYMTAIDKSDNHNVSYGYAVFASNDIADRLDGLETGNLTELGSGEVDLSNASGNLLVRFNSFTADTFKFGADEFGNKSFKLKAVTGKEFQIMFAYDQVSNIQVRFGVRLEGDATGLSGDLFTICGTTVTAEDIGKTFTVSTKLAAFYPGANIAYPLDVNADGILDKDIWLAIDNIEVFTPSAPALTAENKEITQKNGTGITFTAEALGVSGVDYLGNALSGIKVTEVKVDGIVSADYADGDVKEVVPDGVYQIKFTATDRYGITATETVTVKVGNIPPEIAVTSVDNYVKAGTAVTLTQAGIGDYLTVTSEDPFTLSYRVMKNGAEEVKDATEFTLGVGAYYEVFVTATSGSKVTNGYILFAESSLKGELQTLNGEITKVANGLNYVYVGNRLGFAFTGFEWINADDQFGNGGVCLGLGTGNQQLFMPFATHNATVKVGFNLRIEAELSGTGDLLTMGDVHITDADIGKTIAVKYTTSILDNWDARDGMNFSIDTFTVSELLASATGVKIYIDNIAVYEEKAPTLNAAEPEIKKDSGSSLTFTAEALGVSGADYRGHALKELKVTEVKVNGEANTTYTDGTVLQTAPNGIYEITFTGTDRYGMTATKTITVTVGDGDYTAPSFGEYEQLNSVAKNTEITLGANGITDFVTVTDEAGFDLTYRVVKHSAVGAEELAASTANFTVNGDEYYEVFMTAKDKSDNQNTSYGYIIFASNDIADRLNTLSGYTVETLVDGTTNLTKDSSLFMRLYEFPKEAYRYETDEFGNTSLKLKAEAEAKAFQIMFAYDSSKADLYVRFTVRLEGAQTDLNGASFTICGTTVTAGKTSVISTKLTEWIAVGGGISEPLAANADGMKGKDVWVVLDNIELFTPSAPTLNAAEPEIKKDSGASLTFKAEALGVSGTDYLGNALFELKVTKIVYNDVEKTEYTDGHVLENAPNGVYVITLTGTDVYGQSKSVTVTVTVGDADFKKPEYSAYNQLNSVAKNTEITLGTNGIANFVTVTDDAGFDLTYRVVKYGAQGSEELTNVTKFTVEGGEYYEVYMTATDKSDNHNVSYGYAIFAESAIAGGLNMLDGGTIEELGGGECNYNSAAGKNILRFCQFNGENIKYAKDEFGNGSVRLKAAGNAFQIMFYYSGNPGTQKARFTVRLETDLTDLSGELFSMNGVTITASDIGKDFVITTNFFSDAWGASIGFSASDPITFDGIKNKDVWVVIDNIEMFTPSAPALSAEIDSIKQDSGTGITFTAEALGVSGEDYLGNGLKELKVTEVKFNDAVNAEYTDGYELTQAPDGVYKITFTGTDRYGMTANVTVTVKVGSTPPEITAEHVDNYADAGTEIELMQTGIANYLTVTAEDDYSLSYRVMKNGAEEIANASSITIGAGEYYEVYVIATSGSKTSNGYILFAESSLNGVLKTLNSGTEIFDQAGLHCKQDGVHVFTSSNAGKSEVITNPDGSKELCLSEITSGLQFFLRYSDAVGVNVSFTLRIEGEIEGSGDLLTIGTTTVTADQVGTTIAVNYTSTAWFGGENFGLSTADHFTLDGVTVTDLLTSGTNVKIYIDNIIVRAQ